MSELLWKAVYPEMPTTGIGSLPHHNIDAALAYSFRCDIPFVPQIPAKNHKEYMVVQALEKLPGLVSTVKGEATLHLPTWQAESHRLANHLDVAFAAPAGSLLAFETFEPDAEYYSCWQPFVWEAQERKVKVAKVQISGPLTSQWALKLDDGTPADRLPEIGTQIFRLVLARSIAMVRKLKSIGVVPLIYLDEPGFYCYSKQTPKHVLGLQELKIFIQTLKKEKALVGLHCCSNTDWGAVLSLSPDALSIDTVLSLVPMLKTKEIKDFLKQGGRLSLGVVPTARGTVDIQSFEPEKAYEQLVTDFKDQGFSAKETAKILDKAIFTPACGLALHTAEDAEIILSYTAEFRDHCRKYVDANI